MVRNSLPFASLQKSSGEILVYRERSSVDVRLQSAPCGVPTRKGRRQTRNDAVQQLDHARFCRRGRTKCGSVLLPGTEVAFEKEIEFERGFGLFSSWTRQKRTGDKVA